MRLEIPPRFEFRFYIKDKKFLNSEEEAIAHFEDTGIVKGFAGSRACNQGNFIRLIKKMKPDSILEIGPGMAPKLVGSNVFYFDVKSREELTSRYAGEPGANNIPKKIHFVDETGNLTTINQTFDVVFSSHMIEHSLDLIEHLNQVGSLLNPGGFYFIIVPNKNYTFDYFKPVSLAEDAVAHHIACQGQARLSIRSLLLEKCRRTHNDPMKHWSGDHGGWESKSESVNWVSQKFEEINANHLARSGYHSWFFTDRSFIELINDLNRMGLISLGVEACYNTLYGSCSFNAILKRS